MTRRKKIILLDESKLKETRPDIAPTVRLALEVLTSFWGWTRRL